MAGGAAGGTAGTIAQINIAGQNGQSSDTISGAGGGKGGGSPLGGDGVGGGVGGHADASDSPASVGGTPGGGGGGGGEDVAGAAGAPGRIIVWAYSGVVQGGDLAEWYETEEGVEMGDMVSFGEQSFTYITDRGDKRTIPILKKAELGEKIFGVVSSKPGLQMGKDIIGQARSPLPIAFTGRVPTKISTRDGPIKKGDLLKASSIPGVAVRTDKAGEIIGAAMEDYPPARSISSGEVTPDEIGNILVYVNNG